MKRIGLFLLVLLALNLRAADTNAFIFVKAISLPDVHGRIDHMALDARGQRLFVAALGNDTVEVIDLAAGKRIHTIGDCSEPQGLTFVPDANRLFIANGGSGTVKMLDGTDFKVLQGLRNLPDADNMRCDAQAGLIYTGYGEGGLAVISATNGELITKIPLPAHPESFQLEKNDSRIFVNVPDAKEIVMVDRDKRQATTTWPMEEFRANFPMALDEANHRLFVGCRHPARLVVLDAKSGKRISDVEIDGDTDDVFYDAARKRIYVSCGAGFVDVITQRDADKYELLERLPTVSGARTSLFSPERGELYVAVRAGFIAGSAEIQVYKCQE